MGIAKGVAQVVRVIPETNLLQPAINQGASVVIIRLAKLAKVNNVPQYMTIEFQSAAR